MGLVGRRRTVEDITAVLKELVERREASRDAVRGHMDTIIACGKRIAPLIDELAEVKDGLG